MKQILGIATLGLFCFTMASASEIIDLLCFDQKSESCESRVITALDQMRCEVIPETISCRQSGSEPSAEHCRIEASNCSEPRPNMFLTTSCYTGAKSSISKIDTDISLTWWMGYGSYIDYLCVE